MKRINKDVKVNEPVCTVGDIWFLEGKEKYSFLLNKIAAALFRVIDDEEHNQILASKLLNIDGVKGWFVTLHPKDHTIYVTNQRLEGYLIYL